MFKISSNSKNSSSDVKLNQLPIRSPKYIILNNKLLTGPTKGFIGKKSLSVTGMGKNDTIFDSHKTFESMININGNNKQKHITKSIKKEDIKGKLNKLRDKIRNALDNYKEKNIKLKEYTVNLEKANERLRKCIIKKLGQ